MLKSTLAFILCCLLINATSQAQSIGLNSDGSAPHSSAMLDVKSTTQGILIPRLTTTQRTNINLPADGLLVFDSDTESFWFYQDSAWREMQAVDNAIFQKSANVVSTSGGYGTDDFVFGRGALPAAGSTVDTMFFFDQSKAAFRGGRISGSNWEPGKIGSSSFAYGRNAQASGEYSMALGNFARATGYASFAVGEDVLANGDNGSIAMGYISGASGDNSAFAVGVETYANGETSIALGLEAVTYGNYSVALGQNNTAHGTGSSALGTLSSAFGNNSSTLGFRVISNGNNSLSIGQYNEPIVSALTAVGTTSPLFIVGNGDNNSNRSNALVIQKNGNTGVGFNLPRERLDINGALILGTSVSATPVAGTLRYNGSDFQGHNGSSWQSLGSQNTDNQTLGISGNLLTIAGGNTVTLPSGGGGGGGDEIADADNNTKIQVEETADDDIIRFDIDGEEKFKFMNSANGRARIEVDGNNNENILIGKNTGNSLSSTSVVGMNNVFVGQLAGQATTNGSNNVFLGNESGKENGFGSWNTQLGFQSGMNRTGGVGNTYVGAQSGFYNLTGGYNVFLGLHAGQNETGSHRLHIHNNSNSNSANSLIYGEFDNALVRVNGDFEVKTNLDVAGVLEVNDNYRFPTTAGIDGQVLVTDATGDLTWETPVTGGGGGGATDMITDADSDTKIQVEETTDEDIIRFDLAGEEKLRLINSSTGNARLEFGDSNDDNILMGKNAGHNLSASNAVGLKNIIIGRSAGNAITNGVNNIYIGDEVADKNTYGSYNVFLGTRAGYSVGLGSVGGTNVMIGHQAGSGSSGGSRNVFLGPYAGAVENQSDRLHIHNSQPSGPTTSLIYGQFDNQLLRINGNTEINGALQINNAYNFPTTAGTADQVLVSDASGNLSWQSIPSLSNEALPAASNILSGPFEDISFGNTVSIYGDNLLVGAREQSYLPTINGYGAAHFYDKDAYDWKHNSRVLSDDPNTLSFASSVDMDNDNMVVGAYDGYDFQGKVFYYSYTASGVTKLTTVRSSDIANLDRFGEAVALSGDYVVAGAPKKNADQGGAYVFKYNGTSLIEEAILSETGTTKYGQAVDIDGDYLVVGAPSTAGGGKAYIYFRTGTTWNLQHTVNSFDFETGTSVSIDGDKVAIGAPFGTTQNVQILKRTGTTWTLEEAVSPIDNRNQDKFGQSVCIQGNKLVVGAPNVDYNGTNTGAVYAFEFNGSNWILKKKHTHPNAQPSDRIGGSIKLHGDKFIAGGAPSDKVFIEEF